MRSTGCSSGGPHLHDLARRMRHQPATQGGLGGTAATRHHFFRRPVYHRDGFLLTSVACILLDKKKQHEFNGGLQQPSNQKQEVKCST